MRTAWVIGGFRRRRFCGPGGGRLLRGVGCCWAIGGPFPELRTGWCVIVSWFFLFYDSDWLRCGNVSSESVEVGSRGICNVVRHPVGWLIYNKFTEVAPTQKREDSKGVGQMDVLEAQFHKAMLEIYATAKRDCKYVATYFLRMVVDKGGLKAARQLLADNRPAEGFTTLWECGRLDLSVEAHVLRPEFAALFTDGERAIARERLEQYGYRP